MFNRRTFVFSLGYLLSSCLSARHRFSANSNDPQIIPKEMPFSIAFIIFDGVTTLDFVGIYDPITQLKSKGYLPKLSWETCAMSSSVKDFFGLTIQIDQVKPDLSNFDMIIVPGGFGTRPLQSSKPFIQWLSSAEKVPYKASVCTGSLLLGAAGFLRERKATTNFNEYAALKPYCKTVVKDRIVEDAKVITAGAVSASLDLGLYICKMLVGEDAKNAIQTRMNYYPCA